MAQIEEENNEKLHWRNDIPRNGLGNLITKANHYAIVVSDVTASLHFYKDILGLQQIKRPNFDRHGAWLTMGNLELHLIKGKPAVHKGDNLIVSHISLETNNIKEVLVGLQRMGVQYSQNVSVPTGDESMIVTQYFIRDPDGYYVEICNCDILTKFCLSQDENQIIEYNENVQQVNPTSVIKLALIANELKNNKRSLEELVLPKEKWAQKVDEEKLQNLLQRTKIYADPMQGESEESLTKALIEANNHVPTATRIIRARKGGKTTFVPPGFFVKGKEEKYQPNAIVEEKAEENVKKEEEVAKEAASEFANIADESVLLRKRGRELLKSFDRDGDGSLTVDELKDLLKSICQGISEEVLEHMVSMVDTNKDGEISEEEVMELLKTQETELQVQAFFNIIDDDKNGKITLPELSKALALVGVDITDEQVEEIFIEGDLDGDGALSAQELAKLLGSCSSLSWLKGK